MLKYYIFGRTHTGQAFMLKPDAVRFTPQGYVFVSILHA